MWFIGVEVEQEMSAPPPKKNPGSAPEFKGYEGLYGIITNLILKDQCKYLNMLNELTIILLLKLNWL